MKGWQLHGPSSPLDRKPGLGIRRGSRRRRDHGGRRGRLGFDTRKLIESAATADGIRAAYAELAQDCGRDDAALVYYSGHGGRFMNRLRQKDPGLPNSLRFIVLTDYAQASGGVFPWILAEELSVMRRDLTERTRNVTTIFDCCHSARMFRAPEVVPRAVVQREQP